ncbi:MAG: GerMN domain-containing protein, partial [Actinomycetota bacterium]
MKVVESARRRRRIQWAAAAVAVAAIAAFMFLGGPGLFDSTGDADPIPPASTGNGNPTVGPTPEGSPTPEPETAATLEIWFIKGETLYSDAYAYQGSSAVAGAALERVLAGVDLGTGLDTQIPDGTEVLGIDIADGVATIDLTEEFESGGGSLSMRMRVAQIVYTLTQFDSVDGVLFMIDGEPVDSIGGEGIDVST